ncbi:MAG: NAD(P)-binding protein [Pseudomonadota bacterium]
MSIPESVAVIGAGAAGLYAGARLKAQGLSVRLFDKSRAIGGRLATRRHDDQRWNHGAPHADGVINRFPELAQRLIEAGAIDATQDRLGHPDGMRFLFSSLADELSLELGEAVSSLEVVDDGLRVPGHRPVDAVLLAVPAPQAVALLEASRIPVPAALQAVTFRPRWTLVLETAEPVPELERVDDSVVRSAELQTIGQPEQRAWVVHATDAWSLAHLEEAKDAAASALHAHLEAVLGRELATTYCRAHRWRYALTDQPLGVPCLWDGRIGLCGDWCLGPTVGDALASAEALVNTLTGALTGRRRPS